MSRRRKDAFYTPLAEGGDLLTHQATKSASRDDASTLGLVTMVIPQPVSTITVDTTIILTTFLTTVVPARSTPCLGPNSSTCGTPLGTTARTSKKTHIPTVPPAAPINSGAGTATESLGSHQTNGPPRDPKDASISTTQKHAIVGGLSGAIAGLVLIGLLLGLFLRRRRQSPSREDGSSSNSRNRLRDSFARNWSQLTAAKNVSRPELPQMSMRSSTPDLNGSLIHVSLGQWPRPFAHNQSFRESVGVSTLRVTNPDPDLSRSSSPPPRGSMESGGSFLRRQRTAITAALLRPNHARTNSSTPSQRRGISVPSISIHHAPSSERVGRSTIAPSFRSHASQSSLHIVQQQAPEDPFQTPTEGSVEEAPPTAWIRLVRPSLTTIQTATGAASRTLSNFGQALNPLRSRSNNADNENEFSPHSVTTYSSAGDPFRLDGHSIRDGNVSIRGRTARPEPVHSPNWRVYEGT